ncbi:MAG: MAPEG family protein [Rhodobacteraceae bacterium]|nr:MAPEG family protein [Paracoccaceae bacterium]
MTPELTALTLAALLQAVQFLLYATPANLELGTTYTSGPRDTPLPRPLSVTTARLQRAMNNHFEGLILFTIAVVVVTLGNQSSPVTVACGWTYLVARILYVPAYALGLTPWRSAIWGVGFFATVIMLVAALI